VDGRPNRGNNAAFSNFSGVVWTEFKIAVNCNGECILTGLACQNTGQLVTYTDIKCLIMTCFLIAPVTISVNNKTATRSFQFMDYELFSLR